MKSWEDGKIELGRELARICATIDKNIFEEINNSSMIAVEKDELKLLRENSSKIEKLVENNVRLVDELERCKTVAARVDILEKKNKALATELNQILSNPQSIHEPRPQVKISPLQTISSTEDKIDAKEYQRLVRKYNILSENCNQLKGAWAKMEGKLRDQKRKSREWALHLENRDKIIKIKSQKTKRLEQELIELKERIGIGGTSASKTFSNPKNGKTSENKKVEELMNNILPNHPDYSLDLEYLSDPPHYKLLASDKCSDQMYNKKYVEPKLIKSSGSSDGKYYPINSPKIIPDMQMSMKRKRESKDDSHSGFESEKITKIPLASRDFQNLIESIDLDDVGKRFETPKKLDKCIQLFGKSNLANDSVLLSSPILEDVNLDKGYSNASCSRNGDINRDINRDSLSRKHEFPEKANLKKTENKYFSPKISQSKCSGLNELLDQEHLKALSEPSSPVFEFGACNKVTTPSNLSFPSPLSSPRGTKFHQQAPQQSSRSKLINNQQRNLRAQPIEKLDTRDFKINPDYNQGYNYAFSEVVRGHARKGLQGCLKPCCAPKYRALAEISITSPEKLSLSQEESDRSLLEEFLGDIAYKLQDMSEMDKKELLIQAKTRDLANKHGIHRHAYNNPETPVGIWNADFPTTQEALEDEKEIAKRKRKTVQERYAEAMRPGGAYKFRDE